jgi:hypothetical protein
MMKTRKDWIRKRRKRSLSHRRICRKLWPRAERAALAAFTSEQSRAAPGQAEAFYRAIPAGSPLDAVPAWAGISDDATLPRGEMFQR